MNSIITVYFLNIFIWAGNLKLMVKSRYVVFILKKWAISLNLTIEFLYKLNNFLTLISKLILYIVIHLNKAIFIISK